MKVSVVLHHVQAAGREQGGKRGADQYTTTVISYYSLFVE
jgi:hypothetical protein